MSSNASCGSWSRRRLRPNLAGVAVWATLVALAPASAWAEQPTVTSQARAANAEFLAFAPPPPDGAGAVCLVDTGVDLNPDTESNVIERLALDGGDPGDVHHTKHGTSMAMVMGGPVNDWGSVGIWPHVKIVSIRAMPPGESSFPFNYYKRAVRECARRATSHRIKAVNLSLGGAGASTGEVDALRDLVVATRQEGLNVVAAAGNDGGEVQYPAAIPESVAVGGTTTSGSFCGFSNRGPALDISAPGCDLDVALVSGEAAYGSGTSDSAALFSTAITALRSFRPDLDATDAEQLMLSTSRVTGAGPVLDVESAFRAAGLGHVVESGEAAAPQEPAVPSSTPPDRPLVGAGSQRLPRPRVRDIRLGRLGVRLLLANLPRNAVVEVRLIYHAGRGEFSRRERTTMRRSAALLIPLPRLWSRIELRYRSLELPASRPVRFRRGSLIQGLRSKSRP